MDSPSAAPRVLVFGAHPDDAEVFAGGLLVRHCQLGSAVRIVSVTDGRSGHHLIAPDKLVEIRRQESLAAAERIGAEAVNLNFPDGALQPDLKLRAAIIEEIRRFVPDLVLTHRTNDYHPDHRAVGIAVQDASYMVTVPHVCSHVPALKQDPVVAYMCDLFTRPNPLRPDIVLDVSPEFDLTVQMSACHASQFFEWLPYHDGLLDTVPEGGPARLEWLGQWYSKMHQARQQHFKQAIVARGLPLDETLKIEVYEVSEYARPLTAERRSLLFPGC